MILFNLSATFKFKVGYDIFMRQKRRWSPHFLNYYYLCFKEKYVHVCMTEQYIPHMITRLVDYTCEITSSSGYKSYFMTTYEISSMYNMIFI